MKGIAYCNEGADTFNTLQLSAPKLKSKRNFFKNFIFQFFHGRDYRLF